MIRAFIAIEIPVELRAAIQEVQTRLKQRLGVKVSWVKIDNLHLTLQFLGEVDASKLETVKAALDEVAACRQPMELTVAGVGAFPGDRHPRILWVGCEDGAGQLKELARAIQHAMTPLGFRAERREFTPHLTIGRITIPRKDAALTRGLDSIKKEGFGTFRVEEFHLVQSQLHPEGSIYTKLSSHRLTGDTDHVVKS